MLQVEGTTPRTTSYDPQGHRMGPVGTLACQFSIVLSLLWMFGALAELILPNTVAIIALLPALGSVFLAPKAVVMRYPVSLSVLALGTIYATSIGWTIDPIATTVSTRSFVPPLVALTLAAGLIPLRDIGQALVWTVRIAVVITIIALVVFPATRTHVSTDAYLDDYPGWHGFFFHKNKMTPFLVFGSASILAFDRSFFAKWGTLGLIGILFLGSTSATGISAGFLVGVTWIWVRVYQSQDDLRNSTIFSAMSAVGFLIVIVGSIMSLATITSAYGKELTFSGRTYIWTASVDAIERRPLLGHGVGALFWQEGITPETAEIWRQVGFPNTHAHNGALDLALQLGLVGLAVFAVLWFTTFGQAWRMLRTEPVLAGWVVTVLIAQMFMSLSEDVYLGGWIGVLVMMKVLLMRRPDSLHAPPIGESSKWA
jgi:O-antigen ligase